MHNNWQAKIAMIWGLHRIPNQFHQLCFHGYKLKWGQMLENFKLQGNPELTSTMYPIKKYSELTMTSLETLLSFSPAVNWILKSKIRTCQSKYPLQSKFCTGVRLWLVTVNPFLIFLLFFVLFTVIHFMFNIICFANLLYLFHGVN